MVLVLRLSVVLVVACSLQGGQPAASGPFGTWGGYGTFGSGYGYGNVHLASSQVASVYFTVVQSSGLSANIMALDAAVTTVQTAVKQLQMKWKTHELHLDAKTLIRFVTKTSTLVDNLTDALSLMATDTTIPIEELADQFERTYKRLKKYAKKDYHKYIDEIKERIGCPLSRKFDDVWEDVSQHINHMARIVAHLKEAIDDSHTRSEPSVAQLPDASNTKNEPSVAELTEAQNREPALENPKVEHDDDSPNRSGHQATIVDLVGALSSSVSKLTGSISILSKIVTSSVTGLSSANAFAGQIFASHNTTFQSLNSTRVAVKTAIQTQLSSVLSKYYGAQQTIKSDISTNLAKLSVFSNSKHLKSLTKKFHQAYIEVYNFLRKRNRTDAVEFKKYTHRMKENADNIMYRAFDMFFDAMHRTIYKAMDVVMERGPNADSCFMTYSSMLTPVYYQMATLSQQCISRETPRWTAIVSAVSDITALILASEMELTTNIARCATYTNYVTSSTDQVQASACMKTNLEDMEDFTALIEPELDQIDKVVREQVRASRYRLENCYFTRLHELTAYLKSIRISMEYCAGRNEDCPRKNRDNDDRDWYDRERCDNGDDAGKKKEDGGMIQDNKGDDDMLRKANKTMKKCKRRDNQDTNTDQNKDSNESNSEEDDSEENSNKEKNSGENKDKDKDNKDSQEKGSSEEDSQEDSGENSSTTMTPPMTTIPPMTTSPTSGPTDPGSSSPLSTTPTTPMTSSSSITTSDPSSSTISDPSSSSTSDSTTGMPGSF